MNHEKIKQSQIVEYENNVQLWKNKLKFSLNSFFSFVILLTIYLFNTVMGYLPTIVLLIGSIFFLQQSIRSHNYLKFHKVSLRSLKVLHELVDKKKGS
jgi:hypothetical protein